MIDRITENEEKLDKILKNIKELEKALNTFNENIKDLKLLNNYYGSIKWLKDKEAYENNNISKVKAGVLSEDTVWNMNEDIDDILSEMKSIISKIEKNNSD